MNEEKNNTTDTPQDDFYEHYRYVADPKQTIIRIDKFLMDRVERVSRTKIQKACEAQSILVDGKPVKPNFKIKPGHVVTIVLPKPPSDNTVVAENIPLDIRYEDEDIIVLYKPPGLVVHPGIGNHHGTLVNGLAYYLNQKGDDSDLPILPGNRVDRPGLVHRIDKNTSGLMLIAKNDFAMTHLAKQFFDHTIHRKYVAMIWGNLEEVEGTIEGNIGRHPRNRLQMTVFPEGDEGKHAITHYKVIEDFYYVSLVECVLETGRTHQIRVHFKYLGNPLFNDERYGGDRVVKGTIFTKYRRFVENCFELMPRHALHAKELGFVHPRTGEKMHFETELPEDFQKVIERWRIYLAGRTNKK